MHISEKLPKVTETAPLDQKMVEYQGVDFHKLVDTASAPL